MDIRILDCTLRDGGYINEWKFGKQVIRSILEKLNAAKVDIVECGFLTEQTAMESQSLFNDVLEIKEMLPNRNRNSMFVVMIAIGEKEFDPHKLQPYDGKGIDGIRLTFHQHEIGKAVEWAEIIKSKGYKVFMQPVGTTSYSDLDMLNLICVINEINPYAFYIVDTLGSMYSNELLHTFYLIDKNLNSNIEIGFHAHNNLQMAFSNAQELSKVPTKRKLILDASVYGMGRAAGNLPTELITEYINANITAKYDVMMILDVYDEHISLIRKSYDWGYEVSYHIAASKICHPNYASYLINKQTLTMKDIEKIMISIPKEKRVVFNKKLIEQLYIEYQNNKIDDDKALKEITSAIASREILVLAPGKSILSEFDKINSYIKSKKPYVISVNFVDSMFPSDACFVSNHKRIGSIEAEWKYTKGTRMIATSNLQTNIENTIYVNYYSYINQDELVFDNVGLMLLKLLMKCNVKKVLLAGFDGFKARYDENYYDDELILQLDEFELDEKQVRFKNQLTDVGKIMKVVFLTDSVYEE